MKQKSLFKIIFWVLLSVGMWWGLGKCGHGRINGAFADLDAGIRSNFAEQERIIQANYLYLESYILVADPRPENYDRLKQLQQVMTAQHAFHHFLDSIRFDLLSAASLFADQPLNYQSLNGRYSLVRKKFLSGPSQLLMQIVERSDSLRTAMLALVNSHPSLAASLPLEFSATIDGQCTQAGNTINFREMPLSGALAMLSNLQSLTNASMLFTMYQCNYIWSNKGIMCNWGIWYPSILTNTSYVLSGDRYQADLFFSAYSDKLRNQKPYINGKSVPEKDGIARYEARSDKIGLHTFQVNYQGNIVREHFGQYYLDTLLVSRAFKYYVVAAHPQIHAPSELNYLYADIENPISITAWDDYAIGEVKVLKGDASIKNMGDGKYLITPHSLKTVTLKVGKFATFQYKVHPSPDPMLTLADGISGAFIKQKALVAQSELRATFPADFDFPVDCKILDFHVTRFRKREDPEEVDNQGSAFNSSVRSLLETALSGDRLVFDEVRVLCGKEPTPRVLSGFSVRVE